MEIRAMAQEEQKYTYRQSMQIQGQTGSIGYLRGDFGSRGNEFYTTWNDNRQPLKTEEFQAEFHGVVNALRSEEYGLLESRSRMRSYAGSYPDSAFQGNCGTEYGFRVDTEKHAYLIRCNPIKGDYNFYCFCYVKEWLDSHMKKARQGIRFIDPHYKELFRIPDGEKILITTGWGEKNERVCRFIDEYHSEIGSNLYHICEFAERMEQSGATYEPVQAEPQKDKKYGKVGNFMAQINSKYVRSLSKLMEAGFSDEKAILAMTMDDILALPNISVAEIVMINGIQKAVKANKVITFLGGGEV